MPLCDWITTLVKQRSRLYRTSIDVIRAGQAVSGAYVASPTFSQYGYSWLRDATWIALAMDIVGEHDSARTFHTWAAKTLLRYEKQIAALLAALESGDAPAESDYLPTRFALDGTRGQEDWPDFQLDGYGAWLWGAVEHCRHVSPDLWGQIRPAVDLLVRYLAAMWQSPNYDCWEEFRDRQHTSTLAALYGGLMAVQQHDGDMVPAGLPEAIRDYVLLHGMADYGGLSKFIPPDSSNGKVVDASLLWTAVPFDLLDVTDPRFLSTLGRIEQDLRVPGGGVYRYRDDTYFGGGEWLLLAAWLGWVYVKLGRTDDAIVLHEWIADQANIEGHLPEQVDHNLLHLNYHDEWVDRWGTSANPLLWSHAMYIILEDALATSAGKDFAP